MAEVLSVSSVGIRNKRAVMRECNCPFIMDIMKKITNNMRMVIDYLFEKSAPGGFDLIEYTN